MFAYVNQNIFAPAAKISSPSAFSRIPSEKACGMFSTAHITHKLVLGWGIICARI